MRWVVAAGLRAVVLGLIWVFFAGWSAGYAVYGAFSVAASTALSLGLLPPRGVPDPRRWPRRVWFFAALAGWFLWQSAKGGADVAIRALRRVPDISPEVVVAVVELPESPARQLAMLMMNLMPGSMIQRGPIRREPHQHSDSGTAETAAEVVELHTLSTALGPAQQWRQLQRRAALAFS
ncbi:Na+/H+ antiporter subunit E [Nesterenkonia muleiensis]|uniref:Na+/H+ antiporter subunit E n=1 Tax=Nesterenkonia muleiensis TaxID=2282648 RepID=UPI0013004DC7|nr:Na+/H+ antiporter subunit E [Nesterenkonia muleiensis]